MKLILSLSLSLSLECAVRTENAQTAAIEQYKLNPLPTKLVVRTVEKVLHERRLEFRGILHFWFLSKYKKWEKAKDAFYETKKLHLELGISQARKSKFMQPTPLPPRFKFLLPKNEMRDLVKNTFENFMLENLENTRKSFVLEGVSKIDYVANV